MSLLVCAINPGCSACKDGRLRLRISPGQLEEHLNRGIAPCYLLFGAEPLLVEESSDLVRSAAKANGISEILRYCAGIDLKWEALLEQSQTLSLVSSQRLIEIRLPSGRLGEGGSTVLLEFLSAPPQDTILVVLAGRLDKRTQSSRWFKAAQDTGVVMEARPISLRQLPQWIERRLEQNNISAEPGVAARLAHYAEGNLLAAAHEVGKLALLLGRGKTLDVQSLEAMVADHARFNVFSLIDACLAGDARRSIRILAALRRDGTDTSLVLWALVREVRVMATISGHLARGGVRQAVYSDCGVWSSRTRIVTMALDRHRPDFWGGLRARLMATEQAIKGGAPSVGGPWLELERVLLRICGINILGYSG